MANVNQIFNHLVSTNQVALSISNPRQYHNLRTRLVKLYAKHKSTMVELGVADLDNPLSVCASYDEETGIATFRLGRRRGSNGSSEPVEFEILNLEAPK